MAGLSPTGRHHPRGGHGSLVGVRGQLVGSRRGPGTHPQSSTQGQHEAQLGEERERSVCVLAAAGREAHRRLQWCGCHPEHGGARGPLCTVRGATDPRGDGCHAPRTRKHPEEPLRRASSESACRMFGDGAVLGGADLGALGYADAQGQHRQVSAQLSAREPGSLSHREGRSLPPVPRRPGAQGGPVAAQ